ncbi:hypothetical protein KSS87_007068 [Heliosperma pusillum]|nr:hypothetical protein KSS87_007068 [Heliosperma pusillum]
MKEYGNKESWFRLFSICDPGAMLQVSSYVRPLVYSKSKDRVLLELGGLSFGWYCWGNNTFEKITVHWWPAAYAIGPCDTWTFLDSLVSLAKDKDESVSKIRAKEEQKQD